MGIPTRANRSTLIIATIPLPEGPSLLPIVIHLRLPTTTLLRDQITQAHIPILHTAVYKVATTIIPLTVAQYRLRRTQDPQDLLDTTALDDHRLNKTITVITATKATITTVVAAADIWAE